jgi:DNA polymerase-3 subunit gamma/tau
VASLLEVVDSFRDRYIAAGKEVDAAYLVSGLNVLNEAEINYKSARNKRLHVELALIKLCYLGQALQLTGGEPGKKKQPDAMRPVSFRNIPPMELIRREEPGGKVEGAKLIIETAEKSDPARQPSGQGPAPATGGSVTTPVAGGATLGSLSKIRQQFGRQQQNEAASSKPLEPEALQKAWAEYVQLLRENKNPAVQSLELAVLRIKDATGFEVVTSNNLEQKFIEQEKRNLSDHLQKAFANKAISFAVIIEERPDEGEPVDRPLNKREQFQQIVEQYPLVKELKDRLRLELDY